MYGDLKLFNTVINSNPQSIQLNEKIKTLNTQIKNLTTNMRDQNGLKHRLFTLFNNGFWVENPSQLYKDDGLHLNAAGTSKLAASMKFLVLGSLQHYRISRQARGNQEQAPFQQAFPHRRRPTTSLTGYRPPPFQHPFSANNNQSRRR